MDRAQLYFGDVMHRRLAPREHAFRHGVYFVRVRVDASSRVDSRLFSRNGWNLFSLHDADHGPRDGSPLEPWIRGVLSRNGLDCADGAVWLQTFPRVLGYVFNPVSFWLCHDVAGRLRAVLAEVNNTFGEHHNYLVAHPDGRPIEGDDWLEARKVFHVSPFCEVAGRYRFRFTERPGHACFRIDYDSESGPLLVTAVSGAPQLLATAPLLRAFFGYPLLTFAVIARIHYHAARLWAKRVPFFRKPAPPLEEITR